MPIGLSQHGRAFVFLYMVSMVSVVSAKGETLTQPRLLRARSSDPPIQFQMLAVVVAIVGLACLFGLKVLLDTARRIDRHRRACTCLQAKHVRGQSCGRMLPRSVILPRADAARVNRLCHSDLPSFDKTFTVLWICDMCDKRCEDAGEYFERCADCQLNVCSSCAAAGASSADQSSTSTESAIEGCGLGEHNCLWRIVCGVIMMLTLLGTFVALALGCA